jgi:looped-hinge helix DNA binding domain, AbrB family|uniref:AbrB/MazE/SpoVT family DNA-binding domain-containing protein n=1 Tax=Ignisphaera aggregans TaxID=334771 RepID=A0A7J3YUQ0_9CREN
MYSDVVRLDSKGRITIPSVVRLLLNVEEGDKLVLLFDEEGSKIELRIAKANNVVTCKMQDSIRNIVELLSKVGNDVISFYCRCYDASCNKFKCKFVLKEKIVKSLDSNNLECFSTSS